MPSGKIRKRKQFIGDPIACACGCSAMINPLNRDGKPRRFISGHNITREMAKAGAAASLARPDARDIRSRAGKMAWSDPSYRQRMADSNQRQWADPDFRTKTLTAAHEAAKRKWSQDPEYRDKMKAMGRTMMANLHLNKEAMAKANEAQRVRLNRLWKTPEFIHKIARAHANQCGTLRTSKPELRLRDFLNTQGEVFRVNKRFVLGRGYTVPDIFIPLIPMAVYTDGTYWHGSDKKKRRDMEQRTELETSGIEVFVIDQGKNESAEFDRLRRRLFADRMKRVSEVLNECLAKRAA